MATEKITLSGLYNFDNQLFSKLTLPEGIDRDLFIATLMLNAGEFEVLYSKPEFMKNSMVNEYDYDISYDDEDSDSEEVKKDEII